jgi:hypothetical protein
MANLTVNVAEALGLVEAAAQAGLEAAATFYAEAVRQAVATPYPPASAPDSPPHLRTGTLQASVGWNPLPGGGAEMGSGLDYAMWLETGTRRMAARPFLAPTVLARAGEAAEVCRTAAAGAAGGA